MSARPAKLDTYITSQADRGWLALPTRYDDAGFSGGTTDRPALDRLLSDARVGALDQVIVYKIDRLSRSLMDFAQLIGTLNRCGVGLVAVTQQFDTSTSMGKLTLNILLSFAQFERELIAERTRDKVVAARKRGRWTGGPPSLGYDIAPKGGALVVNEEEARRVRQIFELYRQGETLTETLRTLRQRGWRQKSWETRQGTLHSGGEFQKATLHRLLTNPLYIGKVHYAGSLYDGQHEGIVDQGLWDRVQRKLRANGTAGGSGAKNKHGFLLRGLLRCTACDAAMTPSTTRKGSRVYRYYVCTKAQRKGWDSCPTRSVPASEIERVIADRIRAVGKDPKLVRETVKAA